MLTARAVMAIIMLSVMQSLPYLFSHLQHSFRLGQLLYLRDTSITRLMAIDAHTAEETRLLEQ